MARQPRTVTSDHDHAARGRAPHRRHHHQCCGGEGHEQQRRLCRPVAAAEEPDGHRARGQERHPGEQCPAGGHALGEPDDPGPGVVLAVGQGVDEVRAHPQKGGGDHHRRAGPRVPGKAEGDECGEQAERQGVGERADHGRLQPQVVGPGRADGHQVHGGRPPPGQERQRDGCAQRRTRGDADRGRPRRRRPRSACRCGRRRGRARRRTSRCSIRWTVGRPGRPGPRRCSPTAPRPASAASAVVTVTTARVGWRWQARTRPITGSPPCPSASLGGWPRPTLRRRAGAGPGRWSAAVRIRGPGSVEGLG